MECGLSGQSGASVTETTSGEDLMSVIIHHHSVEEAIALVKLMRRGIN